MDNVKEILLQPLISVIIPIYNVGVFLPKCIESVLDQNGDDYEIILVDDGSTDNSSLICDEYRKKSNKVKVIHKENGGLVSARKAGAEKANGKYIANLDGDDWLDSRFFTVMRRIISEYNPEVIHFNYFEVHEDGKQSKKVETGLKNGFYSKDDIHSLLFPVLIESECGRNYDHSVCDYVVERKLYNFGQSMVPDYISIGEDCICSRAFLVNTNSLYVSDEALNYYRINNTSMTKRKKPFGLDYPLYLGEALSAIVREIDYSFQEQICRLVIHNLFNACVSEFYSESPYLITCSRVTECLSNIEYKRYLSLCRYGKLYFKGQLALFILRMRLYFVMKCYCASSYKPW